MKNGVFKKLTSLLLVLAMVLTVLPAIPVAVQAVEPGSIVTASDPQTLTRPNEIYGENTIHAGKITVGKSVSDGTVTLPTGQSFTPGENNFIVTSSQSAQLMGLAHQSTVPADVVFVLDTSGSMDDYNRAEEMVSAANAAIASLMEANPNNRVSVVAFSSQGYGAGTSNNHAASVLSSLSHYDGEAASAHLSWNGRYIQGRDVHEVTTTDHEWVQTGVFPWEGYFKEITTTQQVRANREGYNGGTNIHAGISLGAQQLMNANPNVMVGEHALNRIPFIVLLSDGSPTYIADNDDWYNASMTEQAGSGSDPYEGIGFVTALTAAYYKGAITDHYFGSSASSENRCYIYTIGVDLDEVTGDALGLAQITMDPATYATGSYTESGTASYYNYGNSFNNNTPSATHGFGTYWKNFLASANGGNSDVEVRTNSGRTFTLSAESVTAAKNYVQGRNKAGTSLGYIGGLAYNDDYIDASNPADLTAKFQNLVTDIHEMTISAPTYVDETYGEDFSGYVTYTDPIGEYMEVKQMLGIVADDNYYTGTYVAQNLGAFGSDSDFDALLEKVLSTRMAITSSSGVTAAQLLADASSNNTYNGRKTQAYYNSDTDFSNSIVWWGKTYTSADGYENGAQCLGHALDDSIAYLEDPATVIPEGADVVCRSYFFYGTAGGAISGNHEYLYFVVRVQRSLKAPYQQTVVISAPASLLSAETVLVLEKDGQYTATVNSQEPARVIYEVGLRSDINAQNVAQIVSADYANEAVNGTGSVNYNPETGAYSFFTNDWDRTQSLSSHHRSMTKVTFNAAENNHFYTYQEDTKILLEDGTAYTGTDKPAGTYFYLRTYYDWSGDSTPEEGNVYDAEKKTTLIRINIPASAELLQKADGWYIPAGDHTAVTLQVTGDDTVKSANITGTSEVVAHPHRTGTANDSHYTVFLGNNGILTITADPAKTVKIGDSEINNNGQTVMVGDILTYEIKAVNNEPAAATAIITDTVPTGTRLVEGSITDGGQVDENGKITWQIQLDQGGAQTVSFQVEVLPDALSGQDNVQNITNTAYIQIGNNPTYQTNTTYNPPSGKKVVDANGDAITGGIQVGDTLVYRIRFFNDTGATADVTVTDVIPAGTTYVSGSATHGGTYADGKLTWVIPGVQSGYSGVVSFEVVVDASAKHEADVQPESGNIAITNSAVIRIGENGPEQTTNTTTTELSTGSMAVTKNVVTEDKRDGIFTVTLTETKGELSGTYVLTSSLSGDSTVTFTGGKSEVLSIRHGETLTVKGLPVGAGITVEEIGITAGWSVAYRDNESNDSYEQRVVVSQDQLNTVTVENTYRVTPVTFQLKGTKVYTGSNFPSGSYSFYAKAADENGNILEGDDAISVFTTVNHPETSFTFSAREFTKAEVRYYVVDEAATAIPGVTSSGVKYLLKLDVQDVNAKLVVSASYKTRQGDEAWSADWKAMDWENSGVEFINTYAPQQTTITIGGSKQLTGRHLKAGEFSFQLYHNGKAIATALNDVSTAAPTTGSFAFAPITVTVEDMEGLVSKDFVYQIREIQSGPANVTYDPAIYVVTVTVADQAGQLVETGRTVVRYENDEALAAGKGTDATALSFSNTFNVDDTYISLSGNKTLTGEGAKGLNADDFSFVIYAADAAFQADTTKIVSGAGNAADTDSQGGYVGAIQFANISFTADQLADVQADANGIKAKDFYYVAKELVPGAADPTFNANMKYDLTVYNIHVRLTLNTADGTLDAQILSVNGAAVNSARYTGLNFSNILNPATVSYTPTGNKTTNGAAVAGLRFSFRVIGLGSDINALSQGVVEATGVSAGEKTDGDSIQFTSLVFDADDVGKTFYYLIEENVTNAGSMVTYDDAQYVLAVTVGRNDTNALTVSAAYYLVAEGTSALNSANWSAASEPISFVNTYNANAALNLLAAKRFSGRPLQAGEFDFRLQQLSKQAEGGYRIHADAGVINGVNDAAGVVSFATVIFTYDQINDVNLDRVDAEDANVKYYRFPMLMTETVPESARIPGVTYGDDAYIVVAEWKVTFTDGIPTDSVDPYVVSVHKAAVSGGVYTAQGDNLFTASETTSAVQTGAVFTNSYAPTSAEATLEATKVLTGRELQEAEFTFQLFQGDTLVQTATNAADGKIRFTLNYPSNISADHFTADSDENGHKEAVFTYTLKEVPTVKGGITYSGASYTVQVVVEHNTATAALSVKSVTYYAADGTQLTNASDVVFENLYTTNNASVTPEANKQLLGAEGKELSQENYQFSFQVVELDAQGVPGAVVSTGTNDANGKISFSAIEYTLDDAGVKIYRITELNYADPTVTSDSTAYFLRVDISHAEGVLTAVPSYYTSFEAAVAGNSGMASAPTFVNYYGPGYINLALNVGKEVVSTNTDGYTLADSQFDFSVYNAADVTNGVPNQGAVPVSIGSNDAAGVIHFASITVKREQLTNNQGVFTYVILEENPSDSDATGITIDTKAITVTVTVTDDGYGNLTAAYVYTDGDEQADNDQKFVNKYTADSAEAVIYAYKNLVGKNLADKEYTFLLTDAAGNVIEKTNDAAGNVAFPMIYTATGTYVYTLSERNDNHINVYYDPAVYTVTVTVTDQRGKLVADVAYSTANGNAPVFRNTFTPSDLVVDLSAAIGGTKIVLDANGNAYGSTAGFTFAVTDLSGNPVLDADGNAMIATSDENGNIIFPSFRFSQAGEYHYWVREQATEQAGYQTDAAVWELNILVRYNAGPEDITADGVTVPAGKLYYLAEEVDVFLQQDTASVEQPMVFTNHFLPTPTQVTLQLNKELTGRPLNEGEFSFYLIENDKIVAESINGADGTVIFPLTYNVPGTYAYTVTEVVPTDRLAGVSYDTAEYTFTVEVKAENGALKAYLGQQSGTSLNTGITVTNTYKARDVDAFIEAHKTIDGKELAEGEFSFQLLDAQGNVIQTVKNAASGKISFKLSFGHEDLAGQKSKTFNYTVREVNEGKTGYTYDEATYDVSVVVTDDYRGSLTAQVIYNTESQNAPVFRNSYAPIPVDVLLTALKELTGRDLTEGEFTFQMTLEDGTLISESTNALDGSITFIPVRCMKAGEYKIFLSEVKGNEKGMIYDDTVHEIHIVATDVDGTLQAQITYPDGGAIFRNVYEEPSGPPTGDEFNPTLIISLMAISVLAIGAVLVLGRKKKENA